MSNLKTTLSLTLGLAIALSVAPLVATSLVYAEEKHGEHDHDHDHDHGDAVKLGEATLGGTVFTVELIGKLEAGKEVEIKLMTKGTAPTGKIRGWIGIESGKGSAKGNSHKEDDGLCIHAETPDPIPADAKVWLELEADGTKSKTSVALPK
jgi:hypothetical protein